MDRPEICINVKRPHIPHLSTQNIHNLILWIFSNHKKPDYFTINNKALLKAVNLVFLKEKPQYKVGTGKVVIYSQMPISKYLKSCIYEGTITDSCTFKDFVSYLPLESRIYLVREINSRNRKKHRLKLNVDNKLVFDEKAAVTDRSKDELMNEARGDIIDYINLDLITPENVNFFKARRWRDVYAQQFDYCSDEEIHLEDFTCFKGESSNFIVALDCEMVLTAKGSQVGRVTFLNHEGCVLYDEYVQPQDEVVDYLTHCSGLTQESFINSVSFEGMKRDLALFIGSNTVIIGHSVWNDLNSLKIKHKELIDTSLLFIKNDGRNDKLQLLSTLLLSKSIQDEKHCSISDAMACLELLALKIGERLDYKHGKNVSVLFGEINMCKDISEMKKTGVNAIKFKRVPEKVTLSGFNLFFYEEGGYLRFII